MAPAVHEWTGQGADNLWSSAANWTNGSPATDISGDIDLIFHTNLTNAANLVTQNDIAGLVVDSITFDANAGTGAAGGATSNGYTINGNTIIINTSAAGQNPFGIDITPGVSNAPPNASITTFNAGITLAAANATFRSQDGNHRLIFNGGLNLGGQTLTIDAINPLLTNGPTTAGTEINGIISNGALVKLSNGSLLLSGANSYAGGTTVNGGTTVLTSNSSLGATTATTTLNDPARITMRGGITVQQATLNLNSNQLNAFGTDGNTTNTFQGSVVLMAGAGGVAFGAGVGAAEANSRLIIDGIISGATSTLSLNGAGVIEFTQNNTYTGVTNHNGNNGFGALQINTPGGLGAGGPGNFTQLNRNGAGPTGSALWLNFSGTLQDAALVGEAINFAGSGVNNTGGIRVLGNNTVTIPGNIVFTAGAPWFIGVDSATAGLTTTGVIDDQGANRALTKVGAGALNIGGAAANTYSGGTTVLGGVLNVTNTSPNPLGDNPTSAASNVVSMNNGSTLQVQAGVVIPNSIQLNASSLVGAGAVGAVVSSVGTISPGFSTGVSTAIINVNGVLGLDSASTVRVEINGTTAGTTFDQVNVTGAVSLGGAALSGQLGFTPTAGNTFILINNDGTDPVGGTFAGLPQGSKVAFGGFVFTISYTGGNGNDVVLTAQGPVTPVFAVGTDAGVKARVKVFNTDGSRFTLAPYGNYTGGVRVAVGDITGDGIDDIVTCTAGGRGGQVKVFNGATGALFRRFVAYPGFTGGAYVAVGDINDDGRADIITGADTNTRVKVFDGITNATIRSFVAYPGFAGGVTVASGDINDDGVDDIITGAGARPRVKVFDGLTSAVIRSFAAYPGFNGGITVASGDINDDGVDDIITGAFAGADSRVKVFDGMSSAVIRNFVAYPGFGGRVAVAAKDFNSDGVEDIITGAGPGGGPHVKIFNGVDLGLLDSFFAFSQRFQGGIFVG